MITTILGNLSKQMTQLSQGTSNAASGIGGAGMMSLFGDGIPTYYFQIIVGLYVVEIIFILTILSNGIENGSDKLGERFNLGKNLKKSTITYALIATAIIVLFNMIAGTVLTTMSVS
jgi:hypothetical protein